MVSSIDLDHVALASEHTFDSFNRYRGDLGGQWVMGGFDPGFYWGQVRFANGMRLEMLEPANIDRDDFLRRFLDRNGPGPHHVTFEVPDIRAAIDAATAAGYPPVRVNLADEHWKEAFLHPKASHGIVVQMAQVSEHEHPMPPESPPSRIAAPASLDQIVHAVVDLDSALTLFRDVLGGVPVDRSTGAEDPHVDLAWPGPGRIRLIEARSAALREWVGRRPGRLHHLTFALADPAGVPGARPVDTPEPDPSAGTGATTLFEVAPAANLGVRLHLRPSP